MKVYACYGFRNFILCLGYKGEVIKNYFYNYQILNSDFTIELGSRTVKSHTDIYESDWDVTLVDTGKDALKGCRVKKIEKYVKSDLFMLTYGDGLANINLCDLLTFHRDNGRLGTVTGVRPPSRFGEVKVKGNKIISFAEKPQVSTGLINGGFFVFNRKIFDYLTDEHSCDLEVGALERLAENGELMVYKHKSEWACMDTYRDVLYLNNLWENGRAFWKIW
jgi:glucose-1-phosphate cytidylyltransferase